MKNIVVSLFGLIWFSPCVQSEELITEFNYGLANIEFTEAERTDPTIQINFGKPLGHLVEVNIGYAHLGHYTLVDQSEDINRDVKRKLQGASLNLTKGLRLSNSWLAEYGIGIIRLKQTSTFTDGSEDVRSENSLQFKASIFYKLDNRTRFGFMYSDANVSFVHLRTFTLNLKYTLDIFRQTAICCYMLAFLPFTLLPFNRMFKLWLTINL